MRKILSHFIPFSIYGISLFLFIRFFESLLFTLLGIAFTSLGILLLWDAHYHLKDPWFGSGCKGIIDFGPYSRIRHPMYFGMVMVMAGWSLHLMSEAVLFFGILLTCLLILIAGLEEKMMAKKHGKKYHKYKKKTWF